MVRENNIKSKRGFTIIEVVLVLAIAGLIFLMVFIALPALQRAQRNTQRRDDYSMLVTAVNQYMSSNNGKINNLLRKDGNTQDPNTLDAARWVNSTGEDPNGNPYEVKAYSYTKWHEDTVGVIPTDTITSKDGADNVPGSQVFIVIHANCNGTDNNGDPKPDYDSAARSFAVYGFLEGGGYFCQASGNADTNAKEAQ